MTNCIIVDNCDSSRKLLEDYVRKYSSLNLIGSLGNSEEARNVITKSHDIELVIIDIPIPETDDFRFISSISKQRNIIIVSSSEEYAAQAFDLNIVDYLIKPVSFGRFCKVIDKTIKYFSPKKVNNTDNKEVFIKKGSAYFKLRLSDIIYIEALENYVTLFTKGDRFTIRFTRKAIEEQLLSMNFIRIHRSFIINRNMIDLINENSLNLNVGNPSKILPASKPFNNSLLDQITVLAR
jgi:DNA-binding LytR/AlgR family response regulator